MQNIDWLSWAQFALAGGLGGAVYWAFQTCEVMQKAKAALRRRL